MIRWVWADGTLVAAEEEKAVAELRVMMVAVVVVVAEAVSMRAVGGKLAATQMFASSTVQLAVEVAAASPVEVAAGSPVEVAAASPAVDKPVVQVVAVQFFQLRSEQLRSSHQLNLAH